MNAIASYMLMDMFARLYLSLFFPWISPFEKETKADDKEDWESRQ